jgi:hypothetical protein
VDHYVDSGSPPEGETAGPPTQATSRVDVSSPGWVEPPASGLDQPGRAVAARPPKNVKLMGLERQRRVLSQPGAVAIFILFVSFSLSLVSGVAHAYVPARFSFLKESPPGVQIVIGATGIFACLVLFLIGFAVNRLE